MTPLDLDVPGGVLRALRFGTGPRLILAAHGITASAMSFAAVARHLPGDWSLIALDLRGRGGSNEQPGPYGMDRHASDVCAAAKQLGDEPIVLAGQSMGAYVALRAAATEPARFSRLVLIDGGLPMPAPVGVEPDAALQATVGPALARLNMTFPDQQSYVDFFRAHPALNADWNDDLDAYVRYDLTGTPGSYRSRVNPVAVRDDGRDLIVNAGAVGEDLLRLDLPALLLHAPRGMLGAEPGLLPQPLVRQWTERAPRLQAELVPGTNHYTILMAGDAAALLAARMTDPATWSPS